MSSSVVRIENKLIGNNYPCFIIAEAGSNHNGSLNRAKRLIDIAAWAGADAVKFQTFKADKLYPKKSKSVEYLKKLKINKSIHKLISEMEMPWGWIPKLAGYAKKKNIIFLSTATDEDCVDAIDPYVPAFKVASCELLHIPLLQYISKKQKPIIISVGASKLEEIEEVIKALPKTDISLMQCTIKYPAPLSSINVKVIPILKEMFNIPVGLSDHSLHYLYAPLTAVSAGADLIEKHFTVSKKLPGPDHSFALEPNELKKMVNGIRMAEKVLGKPEKKIQTIENELANYKRAIYTSRSLKKGEKFANDNLIVLRKPGIREKGLAPKLIRQIFQKRSKKNIPAQYLLKTKDIEKFKC